MAVSHPALPKLFPSCYPCGTAPGVCRRQAWGLSQPQAAQGRELPAHSAGNWEGLGGERLQPVAPLELAKMLTPQPRSPVGMELDYPRQNEGGNSDDAFTSRWKGRAKSSA